MSEPFGLTWPGRRASLEAIGLPARTRLVLDQGACLAAAATAHVILGGDNLEALRHLRESHRGAVKLIYLDPPYNTGSGLAYPDSLSHAAWLGMMYPRLAIARELLRADGVLMVSIGDDEAHHVRTILAEIYGERNYCGTFVWEKKRKPSYLAAAMSTRTEFVVTFARDRAAMPTLSTGTTLNGKRYPFNNANNPYGVLHFPAGSVRFGFSDRSVEPQDMSEGNIRTRLLDSVRVAGGTNVSSFRLAGEWRYAQRTVDRFVADGDEICIQRLPFRPNYVSRRERRKAVSNLLTIAGTGTPTYEDATEELRALFGRDVLTYPKPRGLLEYLIDCATGPEDLVVDLFAGSGTTGHAVLALNARDGGRRRYVLVQNDEPTGHPEYATILEITLERMRRAAATFDGGDRGFRLYRLRTESPPGGV